MIIVERPNESDWYEYSVGEFVNMKLHSPDEFTTNIELLKENSPALWFREFLKNINILMRTKYKVRNVSCT